MRSHGSRERAARSRRSFPYDLLPRIITAREWETIERGLIQRLTALNMFLKDIYQDGSILQEGVVPRQLVYSAQHYRREMIGIRPRRDIYVSVAGSDLVRLPEPLRTRASLDAAVAGARRASEPDDRVVDAGRVQRGVLRAHVPRAADGQSPLRPDRVMPMVTWVAPNVTEPDSADQQQQQ
ncbi:MAG TPA: circularly permuted type 2 ATP-grasp protein [Vicinamibacterales bacterium]|nr:circularly permuted type 2 ATP-grasp protein [Vicinamibacterales bacterium]